MPTIEIALPSAEGVSDTALEKELCKKLQLSTSDKLQFRIIKKSLDARSKNIKLVFLVEYVLNGELAPSNFEKRKWQNVSNAKPVAIIGAGPAGLFAAIQLIELNFKPILIERGKTVRDRRRDLAAINKQRIINPDSNYCFGEGGAGTYSDGKLYTRSTKRGNVQRILYTLVECGANENILIETHPHIGTNKLPQIIETMRDKILACGGEFIFNTQFTGFAKNGNTISGVQLTDVQSQHASEMECSAVILATGHSARDVYQHFYDNRYDIECKPFALGVRIEHPQHIIDSVQYHCEVRPDNLPPAAYSLAYTDKNNRGTYSFCMCPGGIIAPAATAPGELVVNGWSPSRRNNPFANSGMVVNIMEEDLKDFAHHGELRALNFQKHIEQQSFIAGGENLTAPAQRLTDFLNDKHSATLPVCSYIPGITSVDLKSIFPAQITNALKEGLKVFGKKMPSYITSEAVLVAAESRTSSPVRIPRHAETLMHTNLKGLFPCAEGAGYAGGIVSAAIDGERCADAVRRYFDA